MLKILSGNHTFLRQQALLELKQKLDLPATFLPAETLSEASFMDLILAQSLFEPQRFLVIYDLASNQAVWQKMTEEAEKIASDPSLCLVLVENKLDSRTKFVKEASKAGYLEIFNLELDKNGRVRDYSGAKSIQFALEQAKKLGLDLNRSQAQRLFRRVGSDPWQIYHALERLALLELPFEQGLEYVPIEPEANVFEILSTALRGDALKLTQSLTDLKQANTEAYRFLALLGSQIFNLLALVSAPDPSEVSADFGINSFALEALRSSAKNLSLNQVKQMVAEFIATDQKIKSSSTDIWLEINLLLQRILELSR